MQDWDLAFSMVSKTCPACSCSHCLVFVFFTCQRKNSMKLRLQLFVASLFSSVVVVVGERVKRGGVFMVKGHSFHEACWICCLTFCRRHISKDNSLELVKACEEPTWNRERSTPHRSETNGIAERAVRRVKAGASSQLVQS